VKAIIIDDEPMAREDLRRLLAEHPDIRIIGEVGTVPTAEQILTELRADVVFLDIQLLGGTGFDLVPLVPSTTRIIFFTSHDEYAIRAFEINALDYLLKPVSADRLADSLARLRALGKQQPPLPHPAENLRGDDRIFIRTDREQRFVPVLEILAITSAGGNYSFVHLKGDKEYMIRRTIKQWENLLPKNEFLRIHRSTIIRRSSIESARKEKNGTWLAVISGTEKTFAFSKRAAGRLKKIMAE
jgi:DNA-binding LytR/AlgR family response regulator